MKTNGMLIGLLVVMFFPINSWAQPSAGMIMYSPDTVAMTVPAGSQAVVPTNIDVVNSQLSTYSLKVTSGMADGNLPLAWISAVPNTTFMIVGNPVTTMLTISVPQGTPSGVYAGHLLSVARATHGLAAPGAGLLITVQVPPDCSGVASFEFTTPDTVYLWPPNHSMEGVVVAGTVTAPTGCSLLETGYAIDDEYGVYTSVGTLAIDGDMSFTLTIPVEAWRKGRDKNGRHYTITLFARDEAGIGSSNPISVIVPHDKRK